MSLLFRAGYFRVGLLNTSYEIKHTLHLPPFLLTYEW